MVQHNSAKALAIVNSDIAAGAVYENTAQGTGDFFVEDVIFSRLLMNHPQHLYARQLNMEFASESFLVNNGGSAWILGYKTEGKNGSPIENLNGGWLELFGGFFYANDGKPTVPLILNRDSHLTANFKDNSGGNRYPVHVRDIRGSDTRDFSGSQSPNGNNMDLYSGSSGIFPPSLSAVTASADSYVRAGSESARNFGTEPLMVVKSSSNSHYTRSSLIRFNTANLSIESGARVYLVLHVDSFYNEGSGERRISLHECANDSWSETAVTWNNQPAAGPLLMDIVVQASDIGHEIALDVTDYVVAQKSSDGLASFMIKQPHELNRGVLLSTRESANPPQLQASGSSLPPAITLRPIADTYSRAGTHSAGKFGTEATLNVKESSDNNYDRRSYLRFDLATITSPVSQAVIVLTVNNIGGENVSNRTIELRKLPDDSWSEASLTWSNQPGYGSLLQSFTVTSALVGSEIAIDVTDYVNSERSGDGKVSFVLTQPNGGQALVGFGSRESAIPPLLEIR